METKELFQRIFRVSKKMKIPVYVVGGYVRDALRAEALGKTINTKDIDFVVAGSGIRFAKAFDEEMEQMGSLVEFPDFDTARYVFPELEIEFAGARSESYQETSRKPKVAPATITEDLSRRDFTVNAMARLVGKAGLEDIVDPFGGQEDLQKKILRTPLAPDETFFDDPLRMMRAIRFASQLQFEIDEEVYRSIIRNSERLRIISAERIQEELLKLLATSKPSVGLWLLYRSKLLDEFFPEISDLAGVEEMAGYTHKDNLSHTFQVVDNIADWSDKVWLRFAGLVHDIAKPQTKKFFSGRGWTFDMHEHLGKKMVYDIARRLRMSRDTTKYVAKLVRWHLQPIALMDEEITDSAVRRLMVNLGEELDDLLILCRSDITTGNQQKKERRLKNYDILERRIQEVREKDAMRAFQSPLRGEEIMELADLKPGPTIGKIKTAIEEAILEGVIPNEYEAAKQYFLKKKEELLRDAKVWESAGKISKKTAGQHIAKKP